MSLFDLIAKILDVFYSVTHNYGLAIVFLTLAVMLLVTPFTFKGTKSMIQMQRLQPEMKKLQTRYKDDRQKLNEEMLKFYRENNISPVGGCLPLLIQIPIFIVLYRVIIGLTNRAPFGQDMGQLVGRGLGGEGSYDAFGYFHPKYLESNSELYQALSHTREMSAFGLDLAESATRALSRGLGHGWPYIMLILLIGASSFYQQRQIQARNTGAQVNPQQQMLMKIMPFFLPVISLTLPAAVTLYFVVSNLWRIGQQALITRTLYAEEATGTITTTAEEVPREKVSFRESLRQMREPGGSPAPAKGPKGGGATGGKSKGVSGAAKGGTAAVGKGSGSASAPSRRPPAPNTNRARDKKKRR